MNPYSERMLGLLGDRSPVESLRATPQRLRQVFARLGDPGLSRTYAPGKWTAREILVHLADVEIGVGFRLRQALAEDGHVIQPFDQDRWAARYGAMPPQLALEAFCALRPLNVALIQSASPEDWERPAMHPERGPESVGVIIRMLAGHDLNHLAQLEAIAAQSSGEPPAVPDLRPRPLS
jgi:hypothetical protein